MEETEVKEEQIPTEDSIEKPSYEQLNTWVNDLAIENKNLRNKLVQVMQVQNKLPYLFEILGHKEFFTQDVLNAASNELVYILFPPKEESDSSQEKTTSEEAE